MLFGRRHRSSGRPPGETRGQPSVPASYVITFDMMEKGAKVRRHGRTVRQIAVMVGTRVCLVTSGDTVDRPTYEALIAAGVVRPPKSTVPPQSAEPPEAE